MTEIMFYRAVGEYGFLSNLWPVPITFPWPPTYDARDFLSAEHAYQHAKPLRDEIREWLVLADTPALVASTAHNLPRWEIRPDWHRVKVDRMRAVLEAKFAQHADLHDKLLATGDATLIEASKTDAFWGIGARGKGKNTLGVLLMELRSKLSHAMGGPP